MFKDIKFYGPAKPLNKTTPDYTQPGASTVLKVTLLLLSTILIAGKKKRSLDALQSTTEDDLEQRLLYKVISDVDQDDCLALAVCHSASVSQRERTSGEENLLRAIGNMEEMPISWSAMGRIEAKYRYAGYVGTQSRDVDDRSVCSMVFDKCQMRPEDVVGILTSGENPCDVIAERLKSSILSKDRKIPYKQSAVGD